MVTNPCCLAQEVLAIDEKCRGSFHGRMTVLVPLLARFQGGSALGSELKRSFGMVQVSSVDIPAGKVQVFSSPTGDAVRVLSIC